MVYENFIETTRIKLQSLNPMGIEIEEEKI